MATQNSANLAYADGAVHPDASLLASLGVGTHFPVVGDIIGVTPISLDTSASLKVHLHDAQYLNFGTAHERCSGARMVRFKRTTTTIPCFEQKFVEVCALA